MSVNIQTFEGLKRLADKTTKKNIKEALGYVPSYTPNIDDDSSNTFYIADSKGNVIFKVDSNGIHSTGLNINNKTLNQIIKESSPTGDYNDLTNKPEITDDNSNVLQIADKSGNVIAIIDAEGVHAINFYVGIDNDEVALKKDIPESISVDEVKDEVKKDVIDIINTSSTYANRVIFDDGVSLEEKYAKGELGGGGGSGGIVEVTELPSEGKANTVYKLIHKNVGTVVPTTGLIENVYLNTSLSIDEVVSLLKPLTYSTDSNIDGTEALVVVQTTDKMLNIYKSVDKDDYMIVRFDSLTPTILFISADYSNVNSAYNFVGWNPTLTNPCVVNQESTFTDDFVPQNDKLTDLFSITPFEEEKIPSEMYYLYKENEWVQISGVNIVSKGGTVVPNNTYVENIYFNTSLSVEEVVALLSQLTYTSEGMSALALNATKPIILSAGVTNGVYIIVDFYNMIPYFASAISTDLPQEVFNFVGWNPNFDGILAINGDLVPNDGSMTVGTENDKLIDLMSITNSFGVGGEIIKTLGGDYEAVDLEFNELPSVWKGTQVPNTGYVEKIYFNTSLSVYEVVSLLSQLTYNNQGMNPLVLPSDGSIALTAINIEGAYMLIDYLTMQSQTPTIYFVSVDIGFGFTGWNPDFNGVIEINQEVIPTDVEGGDPKVGLENDKLTNLISIAPPLEKTINLTRYLDNKQMPMSVKVNIGSTNIVSQDGEIIKTLKGDYEAINLTFNELPIFWQETVFVNGNYVEKLYFNTELTTDEIDAIFSTLTYDDNSHLITQYATAEEGRSGSIYIIKMETNGLNGYTIRISNLDGDSYIYASNQETVEYIRKNFNKIIKVGLNITEFPINNTIHTVSNEISNLTNLISSKPLLKNTINVESYLDNKQMPMSIKVNVEPNLQEKEITENGEYVADEGYDGFSKVTVNVESSGGGEDMLQARVDATNSCEYLFYQYKGDNVDFIKDLDTSNVTNMSSMFNGCSMLKTIPQLDTSNVTNMISMFNGCSMLETIPQLDMIKSTNRSQMFYNCSKLTNLTLLNIKAYVDLSQNEKLTLESLINTVKEFINVGSARILTMGTANLEKIASTYVKFTDSSVTTIPTNEKGDVVVCESTDEGAMLLKDYALLKNWTLA